ncbi:MAG: hypothetical protein NZR01_08100 [Bryobacteraceae bacterium]|nr:hypothetical protein [Bryobacteraceae bacterium]
MTRENDSRNLQVLSVTGSAAQPNGCGDEPDALERHYSLAEVAKLWGISRESARRLFRGRPSVLHLRSLGLSGRRAYVTLRIPASVLRQVHRELRGPKSFAPAGPERADAAADADRRQWLAGLRKRQKRGAGQADPGQGHSE